MSKGIVWHLSSNRWNSAITEYALSANCALNSLGWTNIFSPLKGSAAAHRAAAMGLDIRPMSSFSPRVFAEFARNYSLIKPDVVIVYGGPESFLLRLLPVLQRPLRLRFVGHDQWDDKRFVLRVRKRIDPYFFDRILAPGARVAAQLRPYFRVPVLPIPIGLNTERYRHISATPLHSPRRELLIFGRFDPVKGHEACFRLYRELLPLLADLKPRLHVVGREANLSGQQLLRTAQSLGLTEGDDFRLTAATIDSPAELMSAAAVGFVPSLGSELICRVAEEYLLCGTPILVSGVGSLHELAADWSGLSYGETSTDLPLATIADFIRRAAAETDIQRIQRAETAREIYSFAAMGKALEDAIGVL